MSDDWLILETSGPVGQVGLARDGRVVRTSRLDESRRHARDLALTMGSLLKEEGLAPRDLAGIAVGTGPGSYTGLRVGIVSAKVLAYAVGCRLVAVPTFRAVVERAPGEFRRADVIGDALRGNVYVQGFARTDAGWVAVDALRVEPLANWAGRLPAGAAVTGPGLAHFEGAIPPSVPRIPNGLRDPDVASVFAAARVLEPLSREDQFRLEPLYVRGSSAEEKAKSERNAPSGVPSV